MMTHDFKARYLGFRITPDGAAYIHMAEGRHPPNPYNLRFLLPMLCGTSRFAWRTQMWVSITVAAVCTGILASQHGLSLQQSVVAALLWLGLPSVRFLTIAPVLVDAPGIAQALLAAVLWPIEPVLSVAVVLIGSAIWEKTPIFAALFAWHPMLLVGLIVPALRYLLSRPGPIAPGAVEKAKLEFHQHSGGLRSRVQVFRHASSTVYPWGACLFALTVPDPWWIAALLVAMAQLIVAWDTVRLIQMSAPAVCVAAASAIPDAWVVPVLVAHWVNPLSGEGL